MASTPIGHQWRAALLKDLSSARSSPLFILMTYIRRSRQKWNSLLMTRSSTWPWPVKTLLLLSNGISTILHPGRRRGRCSFTHKNVVSSVSPKSKSSKLYQYHLHGHIFQLETNSKYLGITITSKLSWNNHIWTLCVRKYSLLFSIPPMKSQSFPITHQSQDIHLTHPTTTRVRCCCIWPLDWD